MPILTQEPALFPTNVLEEQPSDVKWWAMYTLSRQEKALMRYLHSHSIAYYCPIAPNKYRAPNGRSRVSYLPLFSNYVFVRGTEEDRYSAVVSGNISRQIEIPDEITFVDQLRAIQMMIDSGRAVTLESKFEPGDAVRIKSGPLAGATGTVIKRQSERRLLIIVKFMQQGVSVAIDDWETERI